VYAFFAYRVNSRQDAEDLTQQAFERALRAWNRFDPRRAPLSTWLLTIARNLLIDHYRAGGSGTSEVALDALDPSELPAANGVRPAIGLEPELARALAGLPQRDREVVALRYGGELTGPEIVELTGLTLANVQQILSRSLRRLRAALEE
jgi:RNA polymerase sigma-70 factor (ECF subfamily)